jgi:hypothetical protein
MYRVNKKYTAQRTEGESTLQKKLHEHWPSEARFLSYDPVIKEIVQSVQF